MYSRVKVESSYYNNMGLAVEGASTYLCEATTDIAKIEAEQPSCSVGSKAIVIPTGEIWIKGASGHFLKFKGVSILDQ